MAKILHLIRHAESEANALGIYQGQSIDTGLTDRGKKQAQAVAKIFKKVEVGTIYTSPFLRTFQTAEIIAKATGLPVKTDKRLIEINHGTWEGKTVDRFNKKEKQMLKQWRENPVGVQMINGENLADVVLRCQEFIEALPEGKYIIVTHDLVIRLMAAMALRHHFKYIWKFYLDNCGVTTISFKPYRLVNLNQNFHLNSFRSILNRQAL